MNQRDTLEMKTLIKNKAALFFIFKSMFRIFID